MSKTIVLFQTTWFIVQCIARGGYGLDVTELEVVTLAFATLTGVIYFFWCDKPLDVRCSIPVHLLKGRLEEIQNNVKKEDTSYQIIFPDQGKEEDEKGAIIPNPLPLSPAQGSTSTPDPGLISVQGKEGDEKGAIFLDQLPSSPAQGYTSTPDPGSISVQGKELDEKGAIFLNPLPSSPAQVSTSTPDPGSISVQGKEGNEKGAIFPNPLPSSPVQGSTFTPDPGSISVQGKEGLENSVILPNPLSSLQAQGSTSTPVSGSISVQGKEGDEKGAIFPNPLPSSPAQVSTSTPDPGSISVQGKEGNEKGAIFPNPLPSSTVQGSTSTPDPGSISVQGQEGNEKGGAISPNPPPSSPVQGSISTPDPGSVSVQGKEGLENSVILPNSLSSLQAQGSTSTPVSGSISVQGKEGDEKGTILPNPLPSSLAQGSTLTPVPTLTRMQRFQAFRRRARSKHGTIFGLGYVFIVYPLILFFKPFNDMINAETLGDKTLRVPTFYSPPNNNSGVALVLGICVSIVFGAIHCIAWSFHFATLAERWAWRISAILVSGLPIVMIAFSGLLTLFDENEHKTTGMELYEAILAFILISMASLYIFARIALLVLPFVALRALAPGAYVQLDWISFLPHI